MQGGPLQTRRVPPGRTAPHKLVSQDFSTRNTSPREATGLMRWVCNIPTPPLGAPTVPSPNRGCCPQELGPDGAHHRISDPDGTQEDLSYSSDLQNEPGGQWDPDQRQGRLPSPCLHRRPVDPSQTLSWGWRASPSVLSPQQPLTSHSQPPALPTHPDLVPDALCPNTPRFQDSAPSHPLLMSLRDQDS